MPRFSFLVAPFVPSDLSHAGDTAILIVATLPKPNAELMTMDGSVSNISQLTLLFLLHTAEITVLFPCLL